MTVAKSIEAIEREALALLRASDRLLGANVGERAYRVTMSLAKTGVAK